MSRPAVVESTGARAVMRVMRSRDQFSIRAWDGMKLFADLRLHQQRSLWAAFQSRDAVTLMQQAITKQVRERHARVIEHIRRSGRR